MRLWSVTIGKQSSMNVKVAKKKFTCGNGGCETNVIKGRKYLISNDIKFCRFCGIIVLEGKEEAIKDCKRELKKG